MLHCSCFELLFGACACLFICLLILLLVFCWFVYACISLWFFVICFLLGVQFSFIFVQWYFFLSFACLCMIAFHCSVLVICFVLCMSLSFLFTVISFFVFCLFVYDCISFCVFVLGFYLLGMLLSFHLSNQMNWDLLQFW